MTPMTHTMLKGSNVPVDAVAVRAVLRWTPGVHADVDASARCCSGPPAVSRRRGW
ncbi:hypothetical protein SCYAM73S_08405 [Streptomyces cyaneofuscatus]